MAEIVKQKDIREIPASFVTGYNSVTVTAGSNAYGLAESEQSNAVGITLGSLAYELSEDGSYYIVTGIGDAAVKHIVIPSKLEDGKPVKEIASWALAGQSITGVEIPGTVTSIGYRAFANCESLTSVVINDGVTSIGSSAFIQCRSLTSVEIPDSVTSIGDEAFRDCAALNTVIVISNNMKAIGQNAFKGCTQITKVTFEDSKNRFIYFKKPQDWGTPYCYYRNEMLGTDNAYPGQAMTQIEDNIYRFSVPYDTTNITFINGTASTAYTKEMLVSIGNNLCWEATDPITAGRITTYTAKVYDYTPAASGFGLNIKSGAFANTGITSLHIPCAVEVIGANAFADCEALETLTFADYGLYTEIGASAFSGCSLLKSVKIPEGVVNINEHAFRDCIALESVNMADSVKIIGNSAFKGCSSLTTLGWGNNNKKADRDKAKLEIISGYAFSDCTNLLWVDIPASVTRIEPNAFDGCSPEDENRFLVYFDDKYTWFTTNYSYFDAAKSTVVTASEIDAGVGVCFISDWKNRYWFKIKNMPAPTLAYDPATYMLTMTDLSGLADYFNIYVNGSTKPKATIYVTETTSGDET